MKKTITCESTDTEDKVKRKEVDETLSASDNLHIFLEMMERQRTTGEREREILRARERVRVREIESY